MNTMNRCLLPSRRLLAASLALSAGLAWLPPATAQDTLQRPIPIAAKRGLLVVTQPPEVLLDGRPDRLSPGTRIRGRNNLLVLSASLVGQELPVRYVRSPEGQIHEVWILTEAEAQARP
jgi:hypothetical protein